MAAEERADRGRLGTFVWVVLIVALILRVTVMLTVFNDAEPYTGDGPFYILNAVETWRLGLPGPEPTGTTWRIEGATTSIGPGYPGFLIPFFQLIPDSQPVAQVVAARIGQAVVDTLTALLIYLIARRLFGERVGRVALVAQALDARAIFVTGAIASETLFIALFAFFMWLYLRAADQQKMGLYRWAGLVLGITLLTRPVALLFPVLLAVHAWFNPVGRRTALRGLAWLVAVAALVLLPWQARTAYLSGEITPVTDTVFVHLWRSAREDGDQLTTDEALREAAEEDTGLTEWQGENPHTEGTEYVAAATEHIAANPLGWAGRILRDTVEAWVQPYGTVLAVPRGSGVRQAVAALVGGSGSLADVLAIPALWRRLLMWVWHWWALLAGAAGVVIASRRGWWRSFPLAAWVVYLTGVTAPLLIEPRYVYPAAFALTVFAAYATVEAWDALRARRGLRPAPSGAATAAAER